MARAEELTAEFDEICRGGGRSSGSNSGRSRRSRRSDSNDGRGGGGVGRADRYVSGGNGHANGDHAAWWPSEEGEGWGGGSSAGGFKSMGDVAQVRIIVCGKLLRPHCLGYTRNHVWFHPRGPRTFVCASFLLFTAGWCSIFWFAGRGLRFRGRPPNHVRCIAFAYPTHTPTGK